MFNFLLVALFNYYFALVLALLAGFLFGVSWHALRRLERETREMHKARTAHPDIHDTVDMIVESLEF
jgi:cbb3-type cytochrome oxidase subunit 3